jgi:hypothetical protein
MKKDAYYFPHYCNARSDVKILKLRRVLGIEGYGIYFMLLEVLREQTEFKYPLESIPELEYEFRTSKEKIFSVINDFALFEIDCDKFFSPKLELYLQPYIEKSQRARDAANKRWKAIKDAKAYAKALPEQCDSNASKVKKSKVKKKDKYIYIENFYKNEIYQNSNSAKIKEYEIFVKILFGENQINEPLSGCLSIPNQVTYDQFVKLLILKNENKKSIGEILQKIENDPKYYTKKKSLYLILNNWLKNKFAK